MTSAIKRAAAGVLYYLGFLHVWQTVVLRRRAVVLMYHRVLTSDEWSRSGSHPGIVVTPDTFAMHLAILKRHFKVLTLSDFADRIERRLPFESSSCLITFDDGWHDNLTHAWPLLERHGLPAVIFLPVDYIGQRRHFWREALSHVLARVARVAHEQPAVRARVLPLLAPFGLNDLLTAAEPPSMAAVIARTGALMLPRDAADRLVEQLCEAIDLDLSRMETADRFLDWPDVETLGVAGATFGGHGSDHLRLGEVPLERAQADIARSRAALDGLLARTVPSFSYPNGAWNTAVAEQVQAAGYRLAFTTDPGFVTAQDNAFALCRINIHEAATATPPLFLARVLGIF